jgi:hypothetical protein
MMQGHAVSSWEPSVRWYKAKNKKGCVYSPKLRAGAETLQMPPQLCVVWTVLMWHRASCQPEEERRKKKKKKKKKNQNKKKTAENDGQRVGGRTLTATHSKNEK